MKFSLDSGISVVLKMIKGDGTGDGATSLQPKVSFKQAGATLFPTIDEQCFVSFPFFFGVKIDRDMNFSMENVKIAKSP